MKQNPQYFDASDYPENNRFGLALLNKKVIGLMKDECAGRVMTAFVGLRSKMYSAQVKGKDVLKKCKGIRACVVKKAITFDDYKTRVDHKTVIYRTQRGFQSRKHILSTIQQTKLALSPFDDKRFLDPNNPYETLPWGHENIPYGLDIEMEEDRARDEALLNVMTGLSAEEEEDVEML